jgi:superfamily II DNA or RNA helicase
MTELRDYQVRLVEQIEATTDRALLVLPTGAGKTVESHHRAGSGDRPARARADTSA